MSVLALRWMFFRCYMSLSEFCRDFFTVRVTKSVRYTVNKGNITIPDTGSITATIFPETVTGEMLHPTVDIFIADHHKAVQ